MRWSEVRWSEVTRSNSLTFNLSVITLYLRDNSISESMWGHVAQLIEVSILLFSSGKINMTLFVIYCYSEKRAAYVVFRVDASSS